MSTLQPIQPIEYAGTAELVPLEKTLADRFTVQFREALKVAEVRRLAHDFEGSLLHLRIAASIVKEMKAAIEGRQIGDRALPGQEGK